MRDLCNINELTVDKMCNVVKCGIKDVVDEMNESNVVLIDDEFTIEIQSIPHSTQLKLEISISESNYEQKEKNLMGNKFYESFNCNKCGKHYYNDKVYKIHLRKCGSKQRAAKTKCLEPSCSLEFYHISRMMNHLEQIHNINCEFSELSFETKDEFFKWKEKEEIQTFSCYIKKCGDNKNKGGVISYYFCQMDGSDKAHCKAGKKKNVHKKWSKGRIKTNLVCPSRIVMKETKSNKVHVKYFMSHNHELKIENTRSRPIMRNTLDKIQQMFSFGSTPKEVHKYLQESSTTNECENNLQLIPLRTLVNMRRQFVSISRLDSDEFISLLLLIEKLQNEKSNPVILYKPIGKPVIVGSHLMESLSNVSDLFVIGIQTSEQAEKMNASMSFLCIDIRIWAIKGPFYLINLISIDNHGKGYPVAHFICNQKDESTLIGLFHSLKIRCPNCNVAVIMTNDSEALGPALIDFCGQVKKQIICPYHLRKIWENKFSNLYKNLDVNTKNSLNCDLNLLITEKSKKKYHQSVNTFCEKYRSLLPKYVQFLKTRYFNQPKIWANCYVHFPCIDKDEEMCCDSFHTKLNSYYLKKKRSTRLDDLMMLLICIEKSYYEEIRQQIGEEHFQHERGLRIPDSNVFIMQKSWFVITPSEPDVSHQVTLICDACIKEFCNERCREPTCLGLCAHLYKCTCNDASGLCKHIHKIHSLVLKGTKSNFLTNDISISDPQVIEFVNENTEVPVFLFSQDDNEMDLLVKCSPQYIMI